MKPALIFCIAFAIAMPIVAQQRPVRMGVFPDATNIQPLKQRDTTRVTTIDFSLQILPPQGRSHREKDVIVLGLFADSSQVLRNGRPLELIPDRALSK